MANIHVFADGVLILGDDRYRCALGPAGVAARKTEGDGATPAGRYPLRRLFYRPDRQKPPITGLPLQPLSTSDGWCDDPTDAAYNSLVSLPRGGSHERMWRDDSLYDLVVEIGYNDDPPVAGRGSAIFMHVAKPDYASTQGCVALAKADLLEILRVLGRETFIEIRPDPAPNAAG